MAVLFLFCGRSRFGFKIDCFGGNKAKEEMDMTSKKNRRLKVYEQAGYGYKEVPAIVMRGKWLKECGFDVGTRYRVECEEGRLVIVRKDTK